MRVLVTTTPGTGHIHPVVPLATALRDAGHDVLWATGRSGHGVVERFGFAPIAAGLDLRERIEGVGARFPEIFEMPPGDRRGAMFAGHFAAVAAGPMATDLGPVIDEVVPDLMVHESAELTCAPLARRRGIPCVNVAFGGAIPSAALAMAGDAIAPIWAAEGVDPDPDLGLYDGPYLHPFPDLLGQRPDAATVRPTRPAHIDGGEGLAAPGWATGFGQDRPAIWVGFGTEMSPLAPWPAVIEAVADL